MITGTAISPEFIYVIKDPSTLMPDPENFGVVMMPLGEVQTVLGQPGVINQILVRLAPGANGEEVSDGKVRRRAVEIGMVGKTGVEIVSGLVEGEEVVRDGSLDLQENAKVVPVRKDGSHQDTVTIFISGN